MTLVPVRMEAPAVLGNLVPLTRQIWDGGRKTAPVYVNRRNVTHITTDNHGHVFIHFIGENSIEVAESLECVAEALS